MPGELTGGLVFLRCECPCSIVHANARGICELSPVVARWRCRTELGDASLRLCASCAAALTDRGRTIVDGPIEPRLSED